MQGGVWVQTKYDDLKNEILSLVPRFGKRNLSSVTLVP